MKSKPARTEAHADFYAQCMKPRRRDRSELESRYVKAYHMRNKYCQNIKTELGRRLYREEELIMKESKEIEANEILRELETKEILERLFKDIMKPRRLEKGATKEHRQAFNILARYTKARLCKEIRAKVNSKIKARRQREVNKMKQLDPSVAKEIKEIFASKIKHRIQREVNIFQQIKQPRKLKHVQKSVPSSENNPVKKPNPTEPINVAEEGQSQITPS